MLVDASVETGKTGMVGTMWRHAPAHQIAKQLMDEAAFGEACQYHTRYLAPGPRLQEAGIALCMALYARSGNSPHRLYAPSSWVRLAKFSPWEQLMPNLGLCQCP